MQFALHTAIHNIPSSFKNIPFAFPAQAINLAFLYNFKTKPQNFMNINWVIKNILKRNRDRETER